MKSMVYFLGEDEGQVDISWRPFSETPKIKASGWMELSDPATGDTIDEPLKVGHTVSLVLRLKQTGSSDTMLSTCSALIGEKYSILI